MAYLPVDLDYSLLAWNDAQKLSFDTSFFLPQQNRRSLLRRDVDVRSWNPPPSADFIYPLTDNSAAMNYATQNALYLPQGQPVYSPPIYHTAQHHHAYQLPQHNTNTHHQTYSVHHPQPQPAVYGTDLSRNDNCAPASSGEVCNPQLVNGISPLESQPGSGDAGNGSPNVPQTSDYVDGSSAVQEPIPYGDDYGESEIESVEDDEDYVGSDDEFFPSSSRKNQRDGKRDSTFGHNARPYPYSFYVERQLRQRSSSRYPDYSTTSSSSDHGSQTTSLEGSSRSDTTAASHRPTYRVRRLHPGSTSTSLTFLTLATGGNETGSSSATSTSSSSGRRRSRAMSSLPVPVPVPHLTKKSRGRRVPTVTSFEDFATTIGKKKGNSGKTSRMYLCEVDGCGKCFARGEHLKRHVRSIHTYEKRKLCFFVVFSG